MTTYFVALLWLNDRGLVPSFLKPFKEPGECLRKSVSLLFVCYLSLLWTLTVLFLTQPGFSDPDKRVLQPRRLNSDALVSVKAMFTRLHNQFDLILTELGFGFWDPFLTVLYGDGTVFSSVEDQDWRDVFSVRVFKTLKRIEDRVRAEGLEVEALLDDGEGDGQSLRWSGAGDDSLVAGFAVLFNRGEVLGEDFFGQSGRAEDDFVVLFGVEAGVDVQDWVRGDTGLDGHI